MKNKKLIYMLISSLVFLGFTSGVKAQVNCCYKASDGVYKYASLPDTTCGSYADHATNLTQAQCIAKNDANKVCCKNGVNTGKAKGACSIGNGESWIDKDSCTTTQSIVSKDMVACGESESDCINNLHGTIGADGCCHYSTTTTAPSGQAYVAPTNETKVCCNSEGTVNAQFNNEDTCKRQGMNWVPKDQCSAPANISNPDGNSAGSDGTTAGSGSTGSDIMNVGFNCDDKDVHSLVKTLKTIYNVLRYSVPIILVILGSIDFLRATISDKEDEME